MQDEMVSEDIFLQAELDAGIHHNNPAFMNLCHACVNAVKDLPIKTVLDYGPGTGCYAEAFHRSGYNVQLWEKFQVHRDYINKHLPHLKIVDSVPTTDLLVFIEVAEHMTDGELDELLTKISPKYILFSSTSERTVWDMAWGHINIKEQTEWVELFKKYGYKLIGKPNVPTEWSKLFERHGSAL